MVAPVLVVERARVAVPVLEAALAPRAVRAPEVVMARMGAQEAWQVLAQSSNFDPRL